MLECNPLDLDAESFDGGPLPRLDDGGGNVCGCDAATEPCKTVTSQLAPPEPLSP